MNKHIACSRDTSHPLPLGSAISSQASSFPWPAIGESHPCSWRCMHSTLPFPSSSNLLLGGTPRMFAVMPHVTNTTRQPRPHKQPRECHHTTIARLHRYSVARPTSALRQQITLDCNADKCSNRGPYVAAPTTCSGGKSFISLPLAVPLPSQSIE